MPSPVAWTVPPFIPQLSSQTPEVVASLSYSSPSPRPPYQREETSYHDTWNSTCGITVDYAFNVKEVPFTPDGQGPSVNMHWYFMHPDTSISSATFPSEFERELETLDRFHDNAQTSIRVPLTHVIPGDSATSGALDAVEPLEISTPVVTRCEWPGTGNSKACDAPITQEDVPTHFRASHGIRKMKQDTLINCQWEECHKWLMRKNFVRHIREHHVGYPRRKKRPSGN